MTTRRRHVPMAVGLLGIVVGMGGLSFAAVPLYEIFCRVTGYGGTTQRAEAAPVPDGAIDRFVTIRFDANVGGTMPWHFKPEQREIRVRVGEQAIAFYEARNPTARPVKGSATFNVTPDKAGIYFAKVDCFCFTEQVLAAGESVRMPVAFFVEPTIMQDRGMNDVTTITLSYTFFEHKMDAGELKKYQTSQAGPAVGRVN